MSATVVHVKNISKETSEKEIKDFFSFCGKISKLDVESAGETQSATVTFEKETAAKTALLLDNTQLGATHVSVSSATGGDDFGHSAVDNEGDEITQEQKPRSRIIAEYLAHGYVIGDQTTQRAIDLDQKHGISTRFLETLQKLDKKTQATTKAKSVDQTYQVTTKATNLASSVWSGLNTYYEKAAGTPTGQKLVDFYLTSTKQVQDIHTEARRLADLKKKEAGGSSGTPETVPGTEKTSCKCSSSASACNCAPDACACTNCGKSDVKSVPGTDKTTCGCGGDTKVCGCAVGHCACSTCPKSQTKPVEGTDKTVCDCKGASNNCPCESGKCACDGCAK